MRPPKAAFIVVAVFIIGFLGITGIQVYRWDADMWFFREGLQAAWPSEWTEEKGEKHLMVLLVDHHEPGWERGAKNSANWCAAYDKVVGGKVLDHSGKPFQYTWFYAVDHQVPESLLELNKLVHKGYGEIEFHWHHHHYKDSVFDVELDKMLKWVACFGAMVSEPGGQPHFCYVAGNWNLDNGRNPAEMGDSRQIDLLCKHGCYADFTFSTVSTQSQPSMVNKIYHVKDTDAGKSYDVGQEAMFGVENNDFMLITGPIFYDFTEAKFEYAAVEGYAPPTKERIAPLIGRAPGVEGLPQWRFLKLYTHGMQSQKTIISPEFVQWLREIKTYCEEHAIKLHFVTARQAYNIVKAAEDGKSGDPEAYLDYVIPQPLNKKQLITKPLPTL